MLLNYIKLLLLGSYLANTSDKKYLLVRVLSNEYNKDSYRDLLTVQRNLNNYGMNTCCIEKRIVYGEHKCFQFDNISEAQNLTRDGSFKEKQNILQEIAELKEEVSELKRLLKEFLASHPKSCKKCTKRKKRDHVGGKRKKLRNKFINDSDRETEEEDEGVELPDSHKTVVGSLRDLLVKKNRQ